MRRTKIVATLGPATDPPRVREKLVERGLDVARINAAHGGPEEHLRRIREIRQEAKRQNRHIAVLLDTPGPKLRVGRIEGGDLHLQADREIFLTGEGSGGRGVIPVTYPSLAREVRAGEPISMADGSVQFRVEQIEGGRIRCRVVAGGTIRSGSGVNLPDTRLSVSLPTKEDVRWLRFAEEHRAAWVGVSFVRFPEEIDRVKSRFRSDSPPSVMAKIEKRQAVLNLKNILGKVEGVMVARGDLGVETDLAEVPMVQKRIVRLANCRVRVSVIATQMLESMIENQRPTRAEVTDVANAVLDGADAVMLSGETAIGKYPVEAVETLESVIRATEDEYAFGGSMAEAERSPLKKSGTISSAGFADPRRSRSPSRSSAEAVPLVACRLSFELSARAIVVPVARLEEALEIVRYRPKAPVLAMAESELLCRKLALLWGVIPLRSACAKETGPCTDEARKWLIEHRLAKIGDPVVVLMPSSLERGFSDTLRVFNL